MMTFEGARSARSSSKDLRVQVSPRFVILTLMSCTLAAFAVGRTARMILLVQPGLAFLQQHAQEQQQQQQQQHALSTPSDQDRRSKGMKLPNPSLKDGKVPPSTLYTSKNFDTALSATIHSRWVVSEGVSSSSSPEACSSSDSSVECTSCTRGNDASRIAVDRDVHHDIEGEIHLPAGQHLLMDIRKVDYDFLASEERLALAMLEVVGECGLTLLSYHCHGLHPIGVSCVGVLLESHVSFHTWPVEGVITLDLFTCGPNSLLPIVPTVERLFSVPRTGATSLIDMPETIWAYKLRGFGENSQESKAALTDLFTFPIGAMTEYKKEIASFFLSKMRIDIYDVLRAPYQTLTSYNRLLTESTSYEAHHPRMFQPDRILFYNGVLQIRNSSAAALYEMYVHPAMLTHRNPRRVAVLGFEDGTMIREVLKHKSVEKVVLLKYDELLLNMTMEYFPEYNDCTFLGNKKANCMDDPRVTNQQAEVDKAAFDVIIVDELDLVEARDEASSMTLKWLRDSLSEEGVLVASMGFAPERYSPAVELDRAQGFMSRLRQLGFAAVRDYELGNLGYEVLWRFAVAFNSRESRESWFNTEAAINLEIRKRMTPPHGDTTLLTVFDGAAQASISFPSRISAEASCRRGNDDSCSRHGFDDMPRMESPVRVLQVSDKEGTLTFDFQSIQVL